MSKSTTVATAACTLSATLLAGCAVDPPSAPPDRPARALWSEIRETVHRDGDDLLSAGLGLRGLRGPAPRLTDSSRDEAALLRRLAIHSNYKGLADLTATGGFARDAALPRVPGREFQAFARLPDAAQPFRVMVQLPDSFDPEDPCLVVAPVSGSRGIYGAVPVAGPWALPRGCAVATTDKGAGTDLFDHASETGVALDGTRAQRGEAPLGFEPLKLDAPLVSLPHAHSGDQPEADWATHTLAATQFGLAMLERAFPEHAPFAPARVRILGAAISNGGGAMLRALEQAEPGLFDAVVVAAPNVTVEGARALYDYATEAALLQPCLLADPATLMRLPFANPTLLPAAEQRCQSLHEQGLLDAPTARAASARLVASGFDPGALEQAAVNATLDVWRSVAAMYASAYLRTPVDAMPCGYQVAVLNQTRNATPASPTARRLWWANSSGVVPGAGVDWIDARTDRFPDDPALGGLLCLRALWNENPRLREAVDQTRADANLPDVPLIVIHGAQDGLIPAAFSARPYIEAARANGASKLVYWEVDGAQHFDALVPLPGMSDRYRPLMPILWQALDRMIGVLDGEQNLGQDRFIRAIDRT